MTSKKNQGFGLLQALLLLAVGSSVIGIVSQRTSTVAKSAKKTESRVDLLGLKSNIYNNVDCAATFAPSLGFGPKGALCSPGSGATGYIDLRSKNGILLNSAGTSRFGKWNALAYCSSGGIEIRFVSLLPAHYGNLADKQWVGKSAPENPSHYRLDEITKAPYSWQHPLSVVSQPNARGLCADWFSAPATSAATCNGFVRNINFRSKKVTCEPMPNCVYPANIVYLPRGNRYGCSASHSDHSYDLEIAKIETSMSNIVNNFYHKVWNEILPTVTYTNNLISNFPNMASYQDVYGDNKKECATRAHMICPEGKVMWGYEAMETAGNRCRIRCVQLKPY